MQEKQKHGHSEKEEDTHAEEQQEHSYYYDDSHGYEVFDPETGDNEESEDED